MRRWTSPATSGCGRQQCAALTLQPYRRRPRLPPAAWRCSQQRGSSLPTRLPLTPVAVGFSSGRAACLAAGAWRVEGEQRLSSASKHTGRHKHILRCLQYLGGQAGGDPPPPSLHSTYNGREPGGRQWPPAEHAGRRRAPAGPAGLPQPAGPPPPAAQHLGGAAAAAGGGSRPPGGHRICQGARARLFATTSKSTRSLAGAAVQLCCLG